MDKENILLSKSEKKALKDPEKYKQEGDSDNPESALASARYQARRKAEDLPKIAETVLSEINLMRTKFFIDNPENSNLEDDETKEVLLNLTEVYADQMVEFTKFYGVDILEYFVDEVLEEQPHKIAKEFEERLVKKNEEFDEDMKQFLGSFGRRMNLRRKVQDRIDGLEGWSSTYLTRDEYASVSKELDFRNVEELSEITDSEIEAILEEKFDKSTIQNRETIAEEQRNMAREIIDGFHYKEFIVERLLKEDSMTRSELVDVKMEEKGVREESKKYGFENNEASSRRPGFTGNMSQSGAALEEAGIIEIEDKGNEEVWSIREEARFLGELIPTSKLHSKLWPFRLPILDYPTSSARD